MSARGYYAAKSRPVCARRLRDCELIPVMMGIHQDNYSVYGVRKIVGWATQTWLTTEALPLQALNQAIETAKDSRNELVHHSDHGSQYVSITYHERLRHKRVQFSLRNTFSLKLRSTTRAETVNGLYKAELTHQHTWDRLTDVEWGNHVLGSLVKHHPPPQQTRLPHTPRNRRPLLSNKPHYTNTRHLGTKPRTVHAL